MVRGLYVAAQLLWATVILALRRTLHNQAFGNQVSSPVYTARHVDNEGLNDSADWEDKQTWIAWIDESLLFLLV